MDHNLRRQVTPFDLGSSHSVLYDDTVHDLRVSGLMPIPTTVGIGIY